MPTDDNPVSDRPEAQSQGNPSKTPSGLASLAGRISSWTSKGILTGIILVAGLAFGRQVLVWWAEDDPVPLSPAPPEARPEDLGDETVEHVMRFGDQPWSMRRQTIAGDVKAAVAGLREKCRRATATGEISTAPPGPQEQTLLESLAGREPVEQEEGKWRVYALDEAGPIVVGVRRATRKATPLGGGHVAGTDLRVVSWGFGVPGSAGGWTLYTFVSASPTSEPTPGAPAIPLPPDCQRTMSMGVAEGGGVVAFRGPLEPETWKIFFDQYFQKHGWTADGPWRQSGGGWSSRYAQGAAPAARTVDVRFGPDGRGRMTGMLLITPGAVKPKESRSS